MSLARRFRRRRLWADSTGPAPLVVLALNRPIQILFFLFVPVLCFYLTVKHLSGSPEGFGILTLPFSDPKVLPDQPSYVVRVTATDRGRIASVTLWEAPGSIEGKKLGADLTVLRHELSRIVHAETSRRLADFTRGLPLQPPPKLVFEIGDPLLHAYVVALLDAATRAGFTDIAFVPIDKSLR